MKSIILTTLGGIGVGVVFILPLWLIDNQKPEPMSIREERVREIKLCLDNNLDAYQANDSSWFCKPRTFKP